MHGMSSRVHSGTFCDHVSPLTGVRVQFRRTAAERGHMCIRLKVKVVLFAQCVYRGLRRCGARAARDVAHVHRGMPVFSPG